VVGPDHTKKKAARKINQNNAPQIGGKGGGRPQAPRGAGKDPAGLPAALAAARQFISGAAN
jgi:alanyl-tRNA synthetase